MDKSKAYKKNNKNSKKNSRNAVFCNALNRFQIKRAFYTGAFAVILFVLIFTVFRSQVYKNIYDDECFLTITALGEKNDSALATNVRITNIEVNGSSYDLSAVNLNGAWEYNAVHHMLYAYNVREPISIDIPIYNVRTVDVTYVKEVGSGLFELSIDGRSIKIIDAYENCEWNNDSIHYKTSPLLFPYSSYLTLLLIFLIFFVLSGLYFPKSEKWDKVFNFISFMLVSFCLSLVLYLIIAFVQRESVIDIFTWAKENTDNFVEGLCIITLLNIGFAMLLKKNYRSFALLSVVFAFLLAVNYFKLQFRDTPLFPWDFLLLGAAASVVSNFKLIPSPIFVLALLMLIAIAVIVFLYSRKKENRDLSIITRCVTFVIVFALLVNYSVTYLFTTGVNLFESKQYYIEKGFVSAFAESAKYLKPIDAPEGYNRDAMEKIYDEIEHIPDNANENNVNIILIMSESFWDITRVKELGFSEEIFPTYRNLQQTSLTGELLVNVYGGGTVNSEFEALTGFSVAYLPTEYMPYQRCMRPDFFSINNYLENKGYESLAIHPFEKTNYNRNTAYEYLGFDKTIWEEDFDENADRMRGYISDHALTEKIIEEYEEHNSQSDAPLFSLSVSMQNHGGYWESSIDSDKSYDIDVNSFKENTQGSIKDLAIGLHYADEALGELIDYFENADEPTLIILFGDHMSDAGPIGETLLNQSTLLDSEYDSTETGKTVSGSSPETILEQRRVPFMAWSNYGNTQKDCGIVSVTQLLPTVLSEYNITMPKYFEYLKECQSVYPACGSNIVVNNDGTCSFVEDITEEQKQVYNENWLIEYDYIFGDRYIKELFDY